MKRIKKIDIFAILICFILYGYSIFIGAPIKDNTNIINLVVLGIFLVYVLVNVIKNKKYKLIRNNLDIFIIILVFSAYISLIFQNYANLEATIEYIIKYTSILCMYIMIRDIIKIDKRYSSYIISTLIISSISIFLLGLDNLTFNYSKQFIELTNNVNVENGDKRFFGIFGYANTIAILMLIISIITIGRYLESNKKQEKIIFNIVIFINISTIIMSYSRATWIISIVIYLGYLLFLKKEDNIKYIELIIRTRNNKCNIQYNNHKIHKSRKRLVCMDAVSDIYSNYIFK